MDVDEYLKRYHEEKANIRKIKKPKKPKEIKCEEIEVI